MKLRIMTGILGAIPQFAYVHPFLAGAGRWRKNCVDDVHVSHTKRAYPVVRCPAEGADKPVAKTFGKREQERARRRG